MLNNVAFIVIRRHVLYILYSLSVYSSESCNN